MNGVRRNCGGGGGDGDSGGARRRKGEQGMWGWETVKVPGSISRHPADPRQGHGRGLHPRDTVSPPLEGRRTIIRTIRNRRRLLAAAGDERDARDAPLSFHPMAVGVKGQRKEYSMKVALSACACHASFVLNPCNEFAHDSCFFPAQFLIGERYFFKGIVVDSIETL